MLFTVISMYIILFHLYVFIERVCVCVGNAFWFHALPFGTRTAATVSVFITMCSSARGINYHYC